MLTKDMYSENVQNSDKSHPTKKSKQHRWVFHRGENRIGQLRLKRYAASLENSKVQIKTKLKKGASIASMVTSKFLIN